MTTPRKMPGWQDMLELFFALLERLAMLEKQRNEARETLKDPERRDDKSVQVWLEDVNLRIERLERVMPWLEVERAKAHLREQAAARASDETDRIDAAITSIAHGMGVEPRRCVICGNLFATRDESSACPEHSDDDEDEDEEVSP